MTKIHCVRRERITGCPPLASFRLMARYVHVDDEHVLDAAEQIGTAIERMLA